MLVRTKPLPVSDQWSDYNVNSYLRTCTQLAIASALS